MSSYGVMTLPTYGGIAKIKEYVQLNMTLQLQTNDVNQDTKKHERLPTIEYLIIEVLIFHSGLLCLFFREKKIYYSDL
jgi:carbamoylphosphate synthase large subunit